jgi:hypothetical protein
MLFYQVVDSRGDDRLCLSDSTKKGNRAVVLGDRVVVLARFAGDDRGGASEVVVNSGKEGIRKETRRRLSSILPE